MPGRQRKTRPVPSQGFISFRTEGHKEHFVTHFANKRWRVPVVITSGTKILRCRDPNFARSPTPNKKKLYRFCPRDGDTRGSPTIWHCPDTRSSTTESGRLWEASFKHWKQNDVPPESGMRSIPDQYSMWNDGRPDHVQRHWPQLSPTTGCNFNGATVLPWTARPPTHVYSR